jgi:hypothetical protein
MTDRSAIDARFGRHTRPPDDPTRDDDSDRVAPAPDGGAGGWEAFDDPDAVTGDRSPASWQDDPDELAGSPERNSRIFSKIGSSGRRPPKAV